MDLDKMTKGELLDLQKKVNAAVKGYDERQRKEAHAKLEGLAKEMGFTLSDFTGSKKTKTTGAAPKYVHPENPGKTWSGRGRQPQWFKDALSSGKTESDLAI